MNTESTIFLKTVLGEDGAAALLKAVSKNPVLENVLVPRTILAWVAISSRLGYEGPIPGYQASLVKFQKSEAGYSGGISGANGAHSFSRESIYHVAASMAVSMGIDTNMPASLSEINLTRLGKSIDLLVKARVVQEQILQKKVLDQGLGYKFSHVHGTTGSMPSTTVNVHSPEGDHIGYATFHHKDGALHPFGVYVDDDHQRKGIASHMYNVAQSVTGKKVVPSTIQTPEGAALWQGNAKTPQFGKSEFKKPDSNLQSEPDYVYHATSEDRLDGIAAQGLLPHQPHEFTDQDEWPDGGQEPRVYFSPQAHMVWHFAPEQGKPVVLRAHQSNVNALKERGTGDAFVRKAVSPQHLEILHEDGNWKPLKQSMGTKTQKAELPGQTAKPTQAAGPLEATPPQKQPGNPNRPKKQTGRSMSPPAQPSAKIPKIPTLKLSEKQITAACPACGGQHMRAGKFVGCMCWRDLAHGVNLTKTEDGYVIGFGKSWDPEAVALFISSVK